LVVRFKEQSAINSHTNS